MKYKQTLKILYYSNMLESYLKKILPTVSPVIKFLKNGFENFWYLLLGILEYMENNEPEQQIKTNTENKMTNANSFDYLELYKQLWRQMCLQNHNDAKRTLSLMGLFQEDAAPKGANDPKWAEIMEALPGFEEFIEDIMSEDDEDDYDIGE